MDPLRPRRLGRKLCLALLVVAVLLAALELGLRLAGVVPQARPLRYRFAGRLDDDPGFFRPDPELFWDLRPGALEPAGGDRINSRGLRGPEVADVAASGTVRIALVGDSCTYGVGIPYERTWAGGLAAGIEERRPDLAVEIVNGGVPGYSTWQGLRFFELRIRPLRPQWVVVALGAWNDFNPALEGDDRTIAERGYENVVGIERLHRLLQHSRLYSWILSQTSGAIRYRHWRKSVDEWLDGEPSGGYRVGLDEFESLLERLVRLCDEDGTGLVFVLWGLNRDFPDPRQARNLERSERYREVLARVAARHGIRAVDLRDLFAGAPDEELFQDLIHASEAGHARLASGLSQVLAEAVPEAAKR